MPSTRRFRVALNLCRLALLCLVCIWGGSFALEINADKLQSLSASRYGPKGAKAVASWLQLLRGPLPPAERDKLTLVNDFWNRSVMSGEDLGPARLLGHAAGIAGQGRR